MRRCGPECGGTFGTIVDKAANAISSNNNNNLSDSSYMLPLTRHVDKAQCNIKRHVG